MKKYVNGQYLEMTTEELAALQTAAAEVERRYWQNVPYDEAVNAEIRKGYSDSQEFAILRQKEEKPEEYEVYYTFCENCKALVKEQKSKYETGV